MKKDTRKPSSRSNQLLISIVMFGVLVWGAYLGIGAVLSSFDVRKGVIVYGCVVGFLIFWGLLVAMRNRRLRLEDEARHSEKPPKETP